MCLTASKPTCSDMVLKFNALQSFAWACFFCLFSYCLIFDTYVGAKKWINQGSGNGFRYLCLYCAVLRFLRRCNKNQEK